MPKAIEDLVERREIKRQALDCRERIVAQAKGQQAVVPLHDPSIAAEPPIEERRLGMVDVEAKTRPSPAALNRAHSRRRRGGNFHDGSPFAEGKRSIRLQK